MVAAGVLVRALAQLCDGDCLRRFKFLGKGMRKWVTLKGALLLAKAAPGPVRGATNAMVSPYPVGSAGRRVAAIRSRYFSYVSRNNRVDYFGTALT
jgi:hypothetical protein